MFMLSLDEAAPFMIFLLYWKACSMRCFLELRAHLIELMAVINSSRLSSVL